MEFSREVPLSPNPTQILPHPPTSTQQTNFSGCVTAFLNAFLTGSLNGFVNGFLTGFMKAFPTAVDATVLQRREVPRAVSSASFARRRGLPGRTCVHLYVRSNVPEGYRAQHFPRRPPARTRNLMRITFRGNLSYGQDQDRAGDARVVSCVHVGGCGRICVGFLKGSALTLSRSARRGQPTQPAKARRRCPGRDCGENTTF